MSNNRIRRLTLIALMLHRKVVLTALCIIVLAGPPAGAAAQDPHGDSPLHSLVDQEAISRERVEGAQKYLEQLRDELRQIERAAADPAFKRDNLKLRRIYYNYLWLLFIHPDVWGQGETERWSVVGPRREQIQRLKQNFADFDRVLPRETTDQIKQGLKDLLGTVWSRTPVSDPDWEIPANDPDGGDWIPDRESARRSFGRECTAVLRCVERALNTIRIFYGSP